MRKKLMWITVIPVVLLLCLYMFMVYQNNRSIEYPQAEQLQRQLGGFRPVAQAGKCRFAGVWFGARELSIRQEQGSFHATAQGVYMLSYILAGLNNTRLK